MNAVGWTMLAGLLAACARGEVPAPDWAEVFAHPDTGTDTAGSYPWEEANWDPSTLACEPVALPREPCEPDRELPLAHAGVVACTEHTDCTDDEFCAKGYCRDKWYEKVLVCLQEASLTGPVVLNRDREIARVPPDLQGFWNPNATHASGPFLKTDVRPGQCAPMWSRCEVWHAVKLGYGSYVGVDLMQPDPEDPTRLLTVPMGRYGFEPTSLSGEPETQHVRALVNAGCQVLPLYRDYPFGTEVAGSVVVSVHYPAPRHPPRPFQRPSPGW